MRRLTVSTLHRVSGDTCRQRWSKVPQLRLAGRWLEAAGFTTGERVTVLVQNGALVITAATAQL